MSDPTVFHIAELNNQNYRWPIEYTTITYTFLESGQLPSYYPAPSSGDKYYNVEDLQSNQRSAIRDLFDYIEKFIPIKFDEAAVGTLGDMTFGLADPGPGNPHAAEAYRAGDGSNTALWGDIWLFRGHGLDTSSDRLFQFNMLHEILHTLGLEHPFNDGVPSEASFASKSLQENQQFSVLSYTPPHSGYNSFEPYLGLYDISELQEIYGRNTNANPSLGPVGAGAGKSDLYGLGGTIDWGSDPVPQVCIYDAGSENSRSTFEDFDILSAAGTSGPALIDLREGRFSTITNFTVVDPEAQPQFSWENNSYADNVSIAFGTTIECAVGSDRNDLIIGNHANNMLDGGLGNDLLFGSGNVKNPSDGGALDTQNARANEYNYKIEDYNLDSGDDLIFGREGNDKLWGGEGNDIILGGGDDDVLHGNDDTENINQSDILDGGEGWNDYYIGGGDVIVNLEAGDRIFWNGIQLTGGIDWFGKSYEDQFPPQSDIFFRYVGEHGEAYGFFSYPETDTHDSYEDAYAGYGGFWHKGGGTNVGLAILLPDSNKPVLIFGVDFKLNDGDPQLIVSDSDSGSNSQYGAVLGQQTTTDAGLTLEAWEKLDSAGVPTAPGYAIDAYNRQVGLQGTGVFGLIFNADATEADEAGQALATVAHIELQALGYDFTTHTWNEATLVKVWEAGIGEGHNSGDHGALSNPDGTNHADANGRPGATSDAIQLVAAAIGAAGSLNTPLVLDLDGDGLELTSLSQSKAYFDLDANGFAQRSGWVTGGDGLLAIDLNSNGNIDNVNELFGATEPYGKATTNGFDVLSAIDSNEDGKIDSSDDKFAELRVWIDTDEDGFTDQGELKTLDELGIEAISLSATASGATNAGNVISDVSTYTKTGGGTGVVGDAWLANSTLDTVDVRNATVSVAAMLMPALRGYGEVGGLRLEMGRNIDLLQQVSDLVLYQARHDGALPSDLLARIGGIIVSWTGAAEAAPRGDNIDPAHLMALERLTGTDFFQATGPEGPDPGPNAAAILESAWDSLSLSVGARILMQSVFKPAFPDVTYEWATDSFLGTLDAAAAVSALAALAPNGAGGDAYSFWKLAVATLDEVASDVGVASGSYDTLLDSALAATGMDIGLQEVRDHTVRSGSGAIFTGDTDSIVFGGDGWDTIRTGAGDDRIIGGGGDDSLNGQGGSDTYIVGTNTGHDHIVDIEAGGSAVDTLLLMAGILPEDVLVSRGGDGGDDLVVRLAGSDAQIVIDGQFSDSDHGIEQIKFSDDTIWTRAFIESLLVLGTENDDTLTGTSNNDFIDGGAGADEMSGGKGSDTYAVDDEGDAVFENVDEGTDLVQSSITYTLGANVEGLVLTAGNIDGTGNELDNFLIGSDGDNVLDGGEGADLLIGGGGYDTFIVDSLGDKVSGYGLVMSSVSWSLSSGGGSELILTGTDDIDGAGNVDSEDGAFTSDDKITGNAGNNTLSGFGGDDTLDGGAGADTLIGGAGNDTYSVDQVDDVIVEQMGGGLDAVIASVSYALSANVEVLTLVGTASYSGTGNDISNRITGNDGGNALYGLGGDDLLVGNEGNDSLYGGDGIDELQGGAGNDTLDGGAGADLLQGGDGNDTYIVDNTSDSVLESLSGGTDLVLSSVTYTLGSSVENLTLTGTASIDGTGNSAANLIVGNAGDNYIDGGSGSDTLNGGDGNDVLQGGNGNDTLSGQGGIDTLLGGSGNDILVWDADDTLDGGANRDTLLHIGTGAIDADTAKLSNIEVVNLGAGDDNDNGIILSVADVLDLAASSSGSGFTAKGDAIDLLIYGDNTTATRDNVDLNGGWTVAGTFSTSALTGSSITFDIYQASGAQVAVQQGLDLTVT